MKPCNQSRDHPSYIYVKVIRAATPTKLLLGMSNQYKYAAALLGAALLASAAPVFAHGGTSGSGDGSAKIGLSGLLESKLGFDLKDGALNGQGAYITPSGEVRILGKVTAINGTALSIASVNGTWTVNAADAKIIGGENAALAHVAIGHQVAVLGTTVNASGLSATGKVITDLSLLPTKGKSGAAANAKPAKPLKKSALGIASDINAAAGTFTLTRKNGATSTVQVNASTSVSVKGDSTNSVQSTSTASLWANIENGTKIRVKGIVDKASGIMTAVRVYLRAK